jgi:hypothetical protein
VIARTAPGDDCTGDKGSASIGSLRFTALASRSFGPMRWPREIDRELSVETSPRRLKTAPQMLSQSCVDNRRELSFAVRCRGAVAPTTFGWRQPTWHFAIGKPYVVSDFCVVGASIYGKMALGLTPPGMPR